MLVLRQGRLNSEGRHDRGRLGDRLQRVSSVAGGVSQVQNDIRDMVSKSKALFSGGKSIRQVEMTRAFKWQIPFVPEVQVLRRTSSDGLSGCMVDKKVRITA